MPQNVNAWHALCFITNQQRKDVFKKIKFLI